MRGAWLLLLAALPASALAGEPSVVLLDWQEGAFAAGAAAPVDGVNARTFPLAVDACHRHVYVDLLYAPEETLLVDALGAEVALLHVFRLDIIADGTVLASRTARSAGYGHSLGVVPEGEHALRVHMTQGADVAWQVRARGWEVPGEAACLPRVVVSEVEADPEGAASPWVELWNQEADAVDLSGWVVASGAGESMLPDGTLVPAGGRLVVPLALAAEDAVELRLLGRVVDRTPTLADAEDDARTWHRGEPWVFAPGTPGA